MDDINFFINTTTLVVGEKRKISQCQFFQYFLALATTITITNKPCFSHFLLIPPPMGFVHVALICQPVRKAMFNASLFFVSILFFQIVFCQQLTLSVKDKCKMPLKQSILCQQINKSNIYTSSHQQCHCLASQHRAHVPAALLTGGLNLGQTQVSGIAHMQAAKVTLQKAYTRLVIQFAAAQ